MMSMISDLVDRLRIEAKSMGTYGIDYMATLLTRSANTIEMLSEKAREPKQGEWIDKGWHGDWQFETDGRGNCWKEFECSNCNKISKARTDFCPNCGTDMRGEQTMSRWSIKECQDILECAIGEVDYHIPEDVIRQTIDYLKELVKTQKELDEERSNAMWEKFPDGFY